MVKFLPFAIFLLATPVAAQSHAVCDPRDDASTCTLHLSVHDIKVIDTAFEKASLAHEVWGPVQEEILRQLRAQQPKSAK